MKYARPGMSLALPVQNPAVPARMLLRVGYELTDEVIAKLKEVGVRSVWVRYPSLATLEHVIDAETVRAQAAIVTQVTDTFEQMQGQAVARLNYHEYTKAIAGLIDHMIGRPQSAVFLGDIASDSDDLMRHSSAVTYLALLMGLKLESYVVRERQHVDPARAKEFTGLGLGAMLHDIGITLLPAEVRDRYHATGDESDAAYREHTTLGYRMVRGAVDPTAANVVLHHHQRFDGSGWTGRDFNRLDGRRIHIFSRIAALADTFDTLRRPVGREPQPQVRAMAQLLEPTMMQRFDPRVLGALIAVAPPYPPGMTVRLSDGRFAVCLDHKPEHPCRPTVQFIPDPRELTAAADSDEPGETLDLAEAPDEVFIAEAEECDVTGDNFTLPTGFLEPLVAAWL